MIEQQLAEHRDEIASLIQDEVSRAVSEIDRLSRCFSSRDDLVVQLDSKMDSLIVALDKQHQQLGRFFESFKQQRESQQNVQLEQFTAIRQMLKQISREHDTQHRKCASESTGSRIRRRLLQQTQTPEDANYLRQVHQIQQDIRQIQGQLDTNSTLLQQHKKHTEDHFGEVSGTSSQLQQKIQELIADSRQQLSALKEVKHTQEVSEKHVADQQALVLKAMNDQQHELIQLQAAEVKIVFDSVEALTEQSQSQHFAMLEAVVVLRQQLLEATEDGSQQFRAEDMNKMLHAGTYTDSPKQLQERLRWHSTELHKVHHELTDFATCLSREAWLNHSRLATQHHRDTSDRLIQLMEFSQQCISSQSKVLSELELQRQAARIQLQMLQRLAPLT